MLNKELENFDSYEEENFLSLSDKETSPYWKLNYGSPAPKSSDKLRIEPNKKGQVTQYAKELYVRKNCEYLLLLEVNCLKYKTGKLGIGIGGTKDSLAVSRKTEGFVLLKKIVTFEENMGINFFIGGMNRANLSGVIKNLTLTRLSKRVLNEGDSLERKKHVLNDSEAESIFVEEMNRKCQYLGMKKTVFKNPHGLSSTGQFSTSSDMIKLGLQALGFPEILKVWGAKRHTAKIEGKNYRSIAIETTGSSQELESYYSILGCKTGTLAPNVFNTLMLLCDEDENVFLTTIMQSKTSSSRFMDVKKLVDVARKKMSDPQYIPTEVFEAHSGCILQIKNNPLYWTNFPHKLLYSFNEDEVVPQASLTKIMTAIIMLENIQDLNEKFRINLSDIVGGSGPIIFEGDEITYTDALFLMMLPSSNTIAKAVSRVIGHKLSGNTSKDGSFNFDRNLKDSRELSDSFEQPNQIRETNYIKSIEK